MEIKPKVNDYRPKSRIIKPKEEVATALSSQELKDTLSNLDDDTFDVVVSLGGLDLYYLHSIKDDSKKIVWLHFAWNRFIKSGNNSINELC